MLKYYNVIGKNFRTIKKLRIKGIDGLVYEELEVLIKEGRKFILYRYHFGLFFIFIVRGSSSIHFYESRRSGLASKIVCYLLTFIPMAINGFMIWHALNSIDL